jgi:class 3 adenylate cyclase
MDATERSNRTWLCTVVFLDIVRYSETPVSQQMAMKQQLNTLIARAIERVSAPDRLILDTGDGAALCFMGDPEDALYALLNLRDTLGEQRYAQTAPLLLRIGVNLGPVKLLKDINGQLNAIGDGINVAQRVMNFAEPNQILVSRSFYEVISCLSQEYAQLFHYRGLRKDKHIREHAVYEVMVSHQGGVSADQKLQDAQDYLSSETAILAGEAVSPTHTPINWDPDVLQHLQMRLAHHIGPLARLLVARAAQQAPDLGALCEMLATNIADARERAIFLDNVSPPELPDTLQGTAPPQEVPSAPPAVRWDAKSLRRLEDHLGKYLGPMAKFLVQQETKKAQDLEHLCRLLAAHITAASERSRFLRDVTAH